MFEKALTIRRARLGDEHIDTSDSYFGLGVILQVYDQYARSHELLHAALIGRRKKYGDEHKLVRAVWNELDDLCRKHGYAPACR
jgi:hypothetical protein